MLNSESAISNQQSAISNQQSAISNQGLTPELRVCCADEREEWR
jgi:hypothetical protein